MPDAPPIWPEPINNQPVTIWTKANIDSWIDKVFKLIVMLWLGGNTLQATRTHDQILQARQVQDQTVERQEQAETGRERIERQLLFATWKQAQAQYDFTGEGKDKLAMEAAKKAYDDYRAKHPNGGK